MNEAGTVETWEYLGGQYGFTYLTNWTQTSSGAILRLDRTTRSMSQFLNYGFIRIDGTINNIQEPNQWVNTGFIVIDKASKIELRAETANKYVNAIAFYDNRKNFISGLSNVCDSSDEVYTIEPTEIPANCIYINVCARISQAGVYVGYKPYDYTSVIKKTVSFAGIATPDTDPGTTDQSVFYIATTAGVYSNFNNIIVAPNEVVIISNVTGNWKRTPVSVLSADFSLGLGNSVFKGLDIENSYVSSGGIITSDPQSPYFIRTDYIYIKGSERIIFSGLTSNKYVSSIAYYDENKKYLSSIIAPVSGGGLYSGEIAASAYPEGAVYAIAVADQRYTETDFRYVPAPFFFVRYPVDKIQEEIDAVKNNVIGISEKLKVSQKTDSINQASFVQGNILTLEEIPDARNYYTIGLSLNITTMGKLSIYNEKTNIYSRGWLDIDAENITEHTASETLRTISHGLTLTDTLSVRIVVDVSTVTITVSNSEGQQFSTILGDWRARKGPNFNLENVEGIYSNVLFSFGGTWFRKPVLFFGDSYADYWPPRLYEKASRILQLMLIPEGTAPTLLFRSRGNSYIAFQRK